MIFEKDYTLQEVLENYSEGPETGVFTDGSARPNPGPGGWGVVWVKAGEIIDQKYGAEPDTTNNRMELLALIEALKMLSDVDQEIIVHTDSNLCVQTINEWAAGWEKRGWKRKTGPIKNLELVKELYELCKAKPNVKLKWIKAHNGWLWNEYADSLATAWARDNL
ncbi:MAG: ribonuclease H [Bdellovibrionota bacterium]